MCSSLNLQCFIYELNCGMLSSRMLAPPNNKVHQQSVNLQVCLSNDMRHHTQSVGVHLQVPLKLLITQQECHQFHPS